MANFTAGTSFQTGVTNDVTAAKLNALVADAVPTSNLALASTSGTISNFTSSTATFLGAITGSTNVINIGSGQIYKDASGNVGIGTNSPSTYGVGSKLVVNGAITSGSINYSATFSDGTTNQLRIGHASGVANILTDANAVAICTAGTSEQIRFVGDKVGIGTTGPTDRLTVFGNSFLNYDGSSGLLCRKLSSENRIDSYDYPITSGYPLAILGSAIRFQTGTTSPSEAMRIDSSGNVGIGTGGSAIASKLDVYGIGNFQSLELGKSGQTGNRDCIIDLVGDDTNTDYGLRIARGATGVNADAVMTNKGTGAVILQTEGAGPIILKTTATDRVTIDSSGALILAGSTAQKATGTTWSNPSDVRIKKNIRDYEKGLNSLMQVRVREWEYNGKAGTVNDSKNIGVVADEIENVLPDTVSTYTAKLNEGDENDSQIKKFDASEVTWLLVKSLQELKAENDSLKSRIEALEAK